jgi:hypothetical protein
VDGESRASLSPGGVSSAASYIPAPPAPPDPDDPPEPLSTSKLLDPQARNSAPTKNTDVKSKRFEKPIKHLEFTFERAMAASSGPQDTRALYIASTFSSPRFLVEIRQFSRAFPFVAKICFGHRTMRA